MRRKLRIFFSLLIFMLVFAPFEGRAKLFGAQSFVLDNGLEVVFIPNRRAPIVKQMLWYKSGSVDEAPGKGGSAHLLEHLMFRGTEKISGQAFNRLMEENGAESNAFTSTDVTSYHQFLDVSRLEPAMFAEADRMRNLKISDEDFALERDIVFQERKQRIDNNPTAQFSEEIRRVLWQDSPYGRPVTGTEEEILNLSKDDIEAYYRRYYTPRQAVLVLAGNLDAATARRLAEKYYGKIGGEAEELPARNFPALKKVRSRVEMRHPDVKTPRLLKVFATSSYRHEAEDVYPLRVLAAYMGEGETSKLYKKLVLRDKKALSVSADYNPLSKSYGTFSIGAVPAEGVDTAELEAALRAAWDEALQELSLDEIQKTKQKMLAGLVYLRDNPEDAAYVMGAMRSIGVPLDEIEEQADRIRAVDYRSLRKIARRLTTQSPQVSGILSPEGEKNAL